MAEELSQRHRKVYVLAEFPYPSGYGLHIGHAFTYTAADVYARFLRMSGRDVLFPMGWDAFGLPTENYAIRTGRKPQDVTRENTENYKRQMQALGFHSTGIGRLIPPIRLITNGRSGSLSSCSSMDWLLNKKCRSTGAQKIKLG
jgi:hypothetical protein